MVKKRPDMPTPDDKKKNSRHKKEEHLQLSFICTKKLAYGVQNALLLSFLSLNNKRELLRIFLMKLLQPLFF